MLDQAGPLWSGGRPKAAPMFDEVRSVCRAARRTKKTDNSRPASVYIFTNIGIPQ